MAIEHAASFIKQSSITLQKYFEFLQNRKLQVLSEKVTLDQSGIKTSIFSSFHLTIQKLQNEDLEAFQLLSILGILDGSFIHEPFARKFCKDEWQYTKIKRLLLEYSMIKCNQHVSEFYGHDIEYLTIHSLYQQAVIFILNNQNLISQIVQSCMEKVCVVEGKITEYIYKENLQLLHLGKQHRFQNSIMKFFERNPASTGMRFYAFDSDEKKTFRELFVRIEDKYKNDVHNILLYWAKVFLFFMELRGLTYETSCLKVSVLRKEIKSNIKTDDAKLLITMLYPVDNDFYNRSAIYVIEGRYENALKEIEEYDRNTGNDASSNIKGICYKELRHYDQALKQFLIHPEGGKNEGVNYAKLH